MITLVDLLVVVRHYYDVSGLHHRTASSQDHHHPVYDSARKAGHHRGLHIQQRGLSLNH